MKSLKAAMLVLLLLSTFFLLSTNAFSAVWGTSGDWVLKGENANNLERFFAIGVDPGNELAGWINKDRMDDDKFFANFNVLSLTPNEIQKYMNSKVILVNSSLHYYVCQSEFTSQLSALGFTNNDDYLSYSEMNWLRNNYWTTGFGTFMQNIVQNLEDTYLYNIDKNCQDFIIYTDEPDNKFGGGENERDWIGYREILWKLLEKVRDYGTSNNNKNKLTAIGYGPIYGNVYLHDKWISTVLPTPVDSLAIPGNGPYNDSEKRCWDKSVVLDPLKYYNNVSQTVEYYKDASNLHLLNSYYNFNENPYLAGETVKAIKAGLPSGYGKPVWLWFQASYMIDDNTYANVRCQIYTAITQGCTGIMLYGREGMTDSTKSKAATIAKELSTWQAIYKGTVLSSGKVPARDWYRVPIGNDSLYYAVFQQNGNEYLLITNPKNISGCYAFSSDIPNFTVGLLNYPFPPYFDYAFNLGDKCYDVHLFQGGQGFVFKTVQGAEAFDLLDNTSSDNLLNKENLTESHPQSFTVNVKPNPFNPVTTISYSLTASCHVSLDIYNVKGQKVATLVNQAMSAGKHSVQFNGKGLSSGMYFYRIHAGNNEKVGKMTLMK